MDVEKSVKEENGGMNNSIQEEVKMKEGEAFKKTLQDRIGSFNEEEIWRSRRERIHNALAAAQNAERQDPVEVLAAARRLEEVIRGADIEKFILAIERLANQTDPTAILSCVAPSGTSLLHVAAFAGNDDILRLLLDHVPDHLMAAQNERGSTPLNMAILSKRSRATEMLIGRARGLANAEDKNRILRMKNKYGDTALHEALQINNIDGVRQLLSEDPELVYLMNADHASPLYLASESVDPAVHELLYSLPLEPSSIQGLPPIHGALVRGRLGKYLNLFIGNIHICDRNVVSALQCYPTSVSINPSRVNGYIEDDLVPNLELLIPDLITLMLKKNMKLFAMIDCGGGNIFHLAAYINAHQVLEHLGPETEYLAQQRDMNGDLPIHIASKWGHVNLIEKLLPMSLMYNGRGENILHVAAKYGRTRAVRYLLKRPELEYLIMDRDHAGNTPLHVAAMYSQPAVLIPLVLDARMNPIRINHEGWNALDIAVDRYKREPTVRKVGIMKRTLIYILSTYWKFP